MLGSILKFFLVGLLAIVAAGLVLGVVGMVFGLAVGIASILLFKVAPLVLIGYVILRLVRGKPQKQISAEDRKWLES